MEVARRIGLGLALLGVGAGVAGCGGEATGVAVEPITGLPRSLTPVEERVIDGSNAFAFDLLRQSRAAEPGPNTFVSPLSVSMALGMTLNGAAGESWSQMRDALGFHGLDEAAINAGYRDLVPMILGLDSTVDVALGNALWSDADRVALLPGFIERVETVFGAEAATLDFSDPASVDVINRWVSAVTNGRIEDILDAIPSSSVAYLVNAVHFLGDWRTTFDEDRSHSGTFTRSDGSEVAVTYMADEVGYRGLNFGHPEAVRGVELPYGGGAFTAVAILPPTDQAMRDFLDGIDPATWAGWMSVFDQAAEVEDLARPGFEVRLPRFELEWKTDLVPALQAMGMVDPFVDGLADLSRMNGHRGLFITRVLHQTFVKVDEKGTEAAGATVVEVAETAAPPALAFDRPFLFGIRERYSGTLLFLGVIGDPRG